MIVEEKADFLRHFHTEHESLQMLKMAWYLHDVLGRAHCMENIQMSKLRGDMSHGLVFESLPGMLKADRHGRKSYSTRSLSPSTMK